jgi:acetylornithine deacetylase/succinyl-diaminopimelate desuccinylase-like protein
LPGGGKPPSIPANELSGVLVKKLAAAGLSLALSSLTFAAPREGEAQFRALYEELVETNTTLSAGDCTLAAQRMAAHLKAAGFADGELEIFVPDGHPKEGGLLAVYPGRDSRLKALLLLAHLDVVEAKREDWTRDPFTLMEADGNFYARGAVDDKAEAAIFTDSLARLRASKFEPKRTIKLALTCGEETNGALNGAQWLVQNRRDAIDAAFAINEGAWGELDANGKRVALTIQAGEKTSQNFRFEVTNPGGHSSRPVKDNAITHLAGALMRIAAYDFPVQFNDGNRAYFTAMAKIQDAKGEQDVAHAMRAFLKDPNDAAALALVSAKDPSWNATLRTTCVATTLDAGHATNALPQRARANVNCRIFPGVNAEDVRRKLEELAADPAVKVTTLEVRNANPPVPPLTRQILGPVEKLNAKYFPGVPIVPVLQSGGTDGAFLNSAGIPTYGIMPIFIGPDLGHIHGLNEYINVESLLTGRDFLHELIQAYANQR